MADWMSIHLNHKDKALHGFYAYRVEEDGTLKVLKNGREFTDKRVHDFIRMIALPIVKEAKKKEAAEGQPQPPTPGGQG